MGIDTGIATFESTAPEMELWNKKFHEKCRLVALIDDIVVGWAALQPVSTREVYAGVAEETVYIHSDFWGQGIGGMLLEALISESEKGGFWMLTATILEENEVSIRLHENFGFKIVGSRERVAFHQGRWATTVLMDRRSEVVGVD
jgi:phosphinothricin acetyltransferase